MHRLQSLVLTVCAGLMTLAAIAAEPAKEAKTLLAERGKLILSDDFSQAPAKEWRTGKGTWETVDGALKGSEAKADMHAATIRHPLEFHNAVIQFSFKLDGARQTTLSINDAKGHVCRVLITPTGITVRKDLHDKGGNDKAVVLEAREATIKPGQWHTIVIELMGKEMLASVDGELVAFGAHDAIDVKKANLGLTVGGESVSFKELRVWEASANKDWAVTKTKLEEARKAAATGK